jgi:hypothetical protein
MILRNPTPGPFKKESVNGKLTTVRNLFYGITADIVAVNSSNSAVPADCLRASKA